MLSLIVQGKEVLVRSDLCPRPSTVQTHIQNPEKEDLSRLENLYRELVESLNYFVCMFRVNFE